MYKCKIYKLISSQTDNIYVGCTSNTINGLKHRLSQHKTDYKLNELYKNRGNRKSYQLTKFDDCEIVELESFETNDRKQMFDRERYYIKMNINNCVNFL